MSTFVCEARTVNRLATFIAYHLRTSRIGGEYHHREIFSALGVNDRDPNADPQAEIARALHILNCDAVSQRYPQDSLADLPGRIDEARGDDFPARMEPPTTPHQLLKHLSCFLYQCAEGDVPERPIYKALRDLEHFLAMRIIDDLPEYQQAAWD